MRLVIRPAIATDHDFIAATWSTCWHKPREISPITPAAWRTAVWDSVPAIIARPDVSVLVAGDADKTDRVADLFGWIAFKPHAVELIPNTYTRRPVYQLADGGPLALVFCVYIKGNYRRNGIARALFARAGIDPRADFAHVCHTRTVDDLADKIPNAVWCPHLGRPPHERTIAHGRTAEATEPDAA